MGFIPSTMVITIIIIIITISMVITIIIIILAKRGSFLGLAQSAVCLTLT